MNDAAHSNLPDASQEHQKGIEVDSVPHVARRIHLCLAALHKQSTAVICANNSGRRLPHAVQGTQNQQPLP